MNWELIAIDDASEDGSLKILQDYEKKDRRIKLISLKNNRGQGYARNLAIRKEKVIS